MTNSNPGTVERIDAALRDWRARKLTICVNCHSIIKHHPDPAERAVAQARLRLIQEKFVQVRLTRKLGRYLRGELAPFDVAAHAQIFDAVHLSRESLEGWRVTVNRLRPPSRRLSLERLR